MKLGDIIKTFRKKLGLTQKAFATQCGITQTYLSQIENNQKEPHLSTLKAISSYLHIPLPIIFFLSLENEDVNPEKREAFEKINPAIKSFVDEFFKV